jgi:hypothetical protein
MAAIISKNGRLGVIPFLFSLAFSRVLEIFELEASQSRELPLWM